MVLRGVCVCAILVWIPHLQEVCTCLCIGKPTYVLTLDVHIWLLLLHFPWFFSHKFKEVLRAGNEADIARTVARSAAEVLLGCVGCNAQPGWWSRQESEEGPNYFFAMSAKCRCQWNTLVWHRAGRSQYKCYIQFFLRTQISGKLYMNIYLSMHIRAVT